MLLVGLLAYLGANPEAHEFFHKNSDQADHQCVVTHFAAGEGLYLSPQVVVAPKALAVQRVLVPRREVTVESFDDFLPPACGPPSAGVMT